MVVQYKNKPLLCSGRCDDCLTTIKFSKKNNHETLKNLKPHWNTFKFSVGPARMSLNSPTVTAGTHSAHFDMQHFFWQGKKEEGRWCKERLSKKQNASIFVFFIGQYSLVSCPIILTKYNYNKYILLLLTGSHYIWGRNVLKCVRVWRHIKMHESWWWVDQKRL